MSIDTAYHMLYTVALTVFAVLIGAMLARSVIGPRVTDRILSINMIGTMVICAISILSMHLDEGYLADVALIYGMISFVSVLVFATIYIPAHPGRDKHFHENSQTLVKMKKAARKEEETDFVFGSSSAESTKSSSENSKSKYRTLFREEEGRRNDA